MSIHIQPSGAAIADKVLLPGDPLRAKYIAETFLENAVCYNQVRGMLGYTGSYHGKTGFDTFTHYKSIVDKKTWIDLTIRYRPYHNWKRKLLCLFLK